VGKVPGVRAKKRRAPTEGNQQQSSNNAISQPRPQPTTPAAVPGLPDFLGQSPQEETWQWTTPSRLDATEINYDFLDAHAASTTDMSGSSESMVDTSPTDDFMPTLNLDMDEIWEDTIKAPQPPISDVVPKARREKDGSCVMQCCQLVSDLESYIVADMEGFQILLGIVRKAHEKLNELIGLQQGSRNLRCLMLFCTVCYQIIELLKVCYRTISGPNNHRRTSLLMPGGLGLGGFGFDEEEQSAWQAQRILKEINQGAETVQKIKLLAGVGPDHTTSGATPESASREHCFDDIERRLKDLAARVKGRT
jgi:hypothetical protein